MFISDLYSKNTSLSEDNEKKSVMGKIGSRIAGGVSRAINPAMAGLSIHDIYQSVKDEDYPGAALSAGSALAYGVGSKFPAVAGPAFAVGAGLDVANVLRDPETRAQIAQAVKKPFVPNNTNQRGRGRNILPPGQTAAELQSTDNPDEIDVEMDKLREGGVKTAIDTIKKSISTKADSVFPPKTISNKKIVKTPSIGSKIGPDDYQEGPTQKILYYVVRTGDSLENSPYFPDRDRAEKFIKSLPDSNNYSVQQNLSFSENKERYSASPGLIQSIKDIESGNNPDAVSPKGAMGTMQVMPGTARDPGFGVKPAQDLSAAELERVGQDYFNAMLNKYDGDKRLALIAYNMGPAAADKWLKKGGNVRDLPGETQSYVPKVLGRYQQSDKLPSETPMTAQPSRKTTKLLTPSTALASTSARSNSRQNSRYSPPPGPRYTQPSGVKYIPPPQPELLDPIINQKTRPDSIEQIIKNKSLKKADLEKLIELLRSNPEIFSSIDSDLLNSLQDLTNRYDFTTNITESSLIENTLSLADMLYNELQLTYGDLVSLYGHEVVGDAIHDVVVKHENDIDTDVSTLSAEVLQLLVQRLENQLQETDEDSRADKTQKKDKDDQNAIIQIQADLDKIKNTLNIKESKIYFNVLATSPQECKQKFGLRKDKNGWYLRENANPTKKLDALRAFQIL